MFFLFKGANGKLNGIFHGLTVFRFKGGRTSIEFFKGDRYFCCCFLLDMNGIDNIIDMYTVGIRMVKYNNQQFLILKPILKVIVSKPPPLVTSWGYSSKNLAV